MRALITAALNTNIELAEAGNEDMIKANEGLVRVNEDGTNRGSYVEGRTTFESTRSLLCDELDWVKIEHDELAPGCAFGPCTYLRAELPEHMVGRTGMLLFGDLTPEQLANVQVREGLHAHPEHNPRGLELVLPWEGELAQTREAWAILGPDFQKRTSELLLWTSYPGPLTAKGGQEHLKAIEVLESQGVSALSAEQLALLAPLAVKLQLG